MSKNPSHPSGSKSRRDRVGSGSRHLRARPDLKIESLERRALLASLDLSSPSGASQLQYLPDINPTIDLTVTVGNVSGVLSYTFHDSGGPIQLGENASSAGWTLPDANTAVGPVTSVSSMSLFTGGSNNPGILNIDQTDAPVDINPDDDQTVNIGDGTLQGIDATVTVVPGSGPTNVTVNNSSDPIGSTSVLSQGDGLAQLVGLGTQTIFYSSDFVNSLTIDGGTGGNTLTVDFGDGNPIPPSASGLVYNGGSGGDTLALQGGEFTSENLAANGPGAGEVSLTSVQTTPQTSTIGFTGLVQVNDTVPVDTMTFSAPPGAQSIAVGNAPNVANGGLQIRSSASTPGFATVDLGQKAAIVLDALGQGGPSASPQAVTVNAPSLISGLGSLDVVLGNGNNTVDLVSAITSDQEGTTQTLFELGDGTSAITVASSGIPSPNNSFVSVSGSDNGGSSTMTYDAGGNGVSVTTSSVSTVPGGTGTSQNTVFFNHINPLRIINTPDLPLIGSPRTINAVAGTSLSGVTVASFSDTDPHGALGDFSATINWGDGMTTTADSIVAGLQGAFDVLGSHTYTTTGNFTIVVTINDLGTSYVLSDSDTPPFTVETPGGAQTVVNSTAVVAAPATPFAVTGIPITATEGQPFSGEVATFTSDLEHVAASDFQVTIDWGDKTTPSKGTVTRPGIRVGPYSVSGDHTYNAPGTYVVTVVVTSPDGRSQSSTSTATVAADLTVRNTLDDTNPGSLRHAINEVNAGLGSRITFDIPGTGPFVIAPSTGFTLNNPATIDATSQPGYAGTPIVVLSGANASGQDTSGLTINGGNTTVMGLVINDFNNVGIVLQNLGGDQILGDYIGTDVTGTRPVPNFQGILILGSSGNTIGGTGPHQGNLISGNTSAGVQILDNQDVNDPTQEFDFTGLADHNALFNNLIGTDAAGTSALGNLQGVFINDASFTTIGGTDANQGNVIAGNRSTGVQVLGPVAANTTILGNTLGFNLSRSQALPNGGGADVFVYASPNNMSVPAIQGGNTVLMSGVRSRPLTDGPTVQSVEPQASSDGSISTITITFTMYLDRTRAEMSRNYQVTILGRNNRPIRTIAVGTPVYNGIYRTVVLTLSQAIPAGARYQLRIIGTGNNGVTDLSGNTLDGNQAQFRLPTGSDNLTVFAPSQSTHSSLARSTKAAHPHVKLHKNVRKHRHAD
jgi:hypothetical protein